MPAAPHRILIVKLSSLGDIVHALPVPVSLRATFPGARIAWAVEKKWMPAIARHPDVDEIIPVDTLGARRRPSRWAELRQDVRAVRAFGADYALDLQGTIKSAVITARSGAPHRVGYARAACREPLARFAYTRHVRPHARHVVEQMLELAAALAAAMDPQVPFQRKLEFPFPVPAAVQREVDNWIAENQLGEFAFFSPGGGWASKRWPSDQYASLAEMLERAHGLRVVLNRGPDERDMDDAYRRANEIRARLFSGDVEHLAAILRRARLAVGGDTGPLQLAAALAVPTVALFGPTDPKRNGPYSELCTVIRKTTQTTYRRGNAYSAAMLAIKPEEVAAACGELLARRRLASEPAS
jgi:lipopolysaccharide heptosyltransferase I